MTETQYLADILILLAAAIITVPVFQRLGLGAVLGYLAAGAIVGPWGFCFINEIQEIRHIAQRERAWKVDRLIPVVEAMAADEDGRRDLAAICASYLREHRPETTVQDEAGKSAAELLPGILEGALSKLTWPKSMRWGAGQLRWVRPLQSILCLFDGEIVAFDVDGIEAGNVTRGHRFMGPEAFTVSDFEDYETKLK